MGKHTAGPWRVFNHSWSDISIVAPNFDHGICSLDINHATEESQEADEAQMQANAQLIASAPELLEALELIAGEPREDAATWMRGVARAAIAKARGEV